MPAIGPLTFAGAPVTTTSSGIFVPPTTSECAAIRLRAPMTAPSSTVAVVGDHGLRADVHAVDHAAVRNRRARADVDGNARRGVQYAAVLHVGALTDDDRGEVGTQDRVEPHRRTRLDVNVADQRGSGRDERARIDRR